MAILWHRPLVRLERPQSSKRNRYNHGLGGGYMPGYKQEITALLGQVRRGDPKAASQLIGLVYPELRRLAQHYMGRERPGHTLQATALVHEVYLRIFGSEPIEWQDRAHFFAVAAKQMRQILVDHARAREAARRGGPRVQVSLGAVTEVALQPDYDLIALDETLARLEALDPRASRMVELRFFGGLTEAEAAEALGISPATLKRDWEFARAWLFDQLRSNPEP